MRSAELAARLGVSRVTAFKRVQSGAIPAQMVGHRYVISGETASALMRKRADKIEAGVERVFAEYGDALERLGRE